MRQAFWDAWVLVLVAATLSDGDSDAAQRCAAPGAGSVGCGDDGGATAADSTEDCWSRALLGDCVSDGGLTLAACPTSCDKVVQAAERGNTAPPRPRRGAYVRAAGSLHELSPPHSAANPPPGHLGTVFDLPNHVGEVDEVGIADLPSPHEFYRLYAPTIDAQQRSKQCSAATDKVCGKVCRKECRKKCRAENAQALNFYCYDPGRGVPLVFRGLARKLASSFDRWGTPKSLARMFGDEKLTAVEYGHRQESRKHQMIGHLTLRGLLDEIGEDTDELAHYAVSPITKKMAKGLFLPPFARCGGGTSEKVKMNLWMSGGGTRSVIHSDPYDNINCVFAGSKRFFIVDGEFYPTVTHPRCGWVNAQAMARAASPKVLAGKNGVDIQQMFGYGEWAGNINVSAVDLVDFPCWANLPWKSAMLQSGDCLYIPQHHLHHVQSDGGGENLSVATNLWLKRPRAFSPKKGYGCDATGKPVSMAKVNRLWKPKAS